MRKNLLCGLVFLGLILMLQASEAPAVQGQAAPVAAAPARQRAVLPGTSAVTADKDFGRMPLYFIANRGQFDNQVAYYLEGADKALYFTPQGLTYVLSRPLPRAKERADQSRADLREKPLKKTESWVVKLDYIGANPDVRPVGEDQTDAVISYFRGSRDEWKTGIPTYSRIVYPGLWPGVDLVYSGTSRQLKYEFVIQPGADPAQIRLAYRGAKEVTLNQDGQLEVKTPVGSFYDANPVAFQEIEGRRVPVAVSYDLEGPTPDSPTAVYGFDLGEYDPTQALIIDPAVIVYCGYIGGSSYDYGYGIAVDRNGTAYVTGEAYSGSGFPAAVGPDTSHNGSYDAFVAKVNSQGTGLLYCGFIGGSGFDRGAGVAVDVNGAAYVVGQTQSSEATFPETVGPDLTFNGGWDVFVAKVNPGGTALVYCGYIGGSGDDFPAWGGHSGSGIAIDASGNAYIAGDTASTEATFPETVGPDLTYNGGDVDDFVAKVSATGATLVYCGYIGGTDYESCLGIAVDGSGCAYLVGYAFDNAAFPVAVGPDLTHNGSIDTWVAKLNSAGTNWVYCGWIGGSNDDRGWGIAVDGGGNAYVIGYTTSTNLPVSGGLDPSFNGYYDAFVAKVDSAGTGLMYCGYIGGTGGEYAYNVAVDGAGCAYVVGYTSSSEAQGFPATVGPDLTYNSGSDAFIAKVNPAGSALVYCGYIGGAEGESAGGVAVDICANAFVTGYTSSTQTTFPETVGPDLTYNTNDDAFVAKISSAISGKNTIAADIDGDNKDEILGDFDYQGLWYWNDGSWTQISGVNVENLSAGDFDGDSTDEFSGDFGPVGLWLWDSGAWTQLSGVNCDAVAVANIDGNADDEIVGDFGNTGLWLWDSGAWTQLSGVNVEQAAALDMDGNGDDEVAGDFGPVGLWIYDGVAWVQYSGVNCEFVLGANIDGAGGDEIIGDFGVLGVWKWQGTWEQISSLSPEQMVRADEDGAGDEEVFADFGSIGLWVWASGVWSQISNVNVDFLAAANMDGGSDIEIVADLGSLGLWGYDDGSWGQLSPSAGEHVLAADVDGNGSDEVVADLNYLGLWLRSAGSWSQLR